MEQRGKVIAILQPRQGVSKSGTQWTSQEFVIETEGQYPKKMCFEVFGDKLEKFGPLLQQGNIINVGFDIDAREWQGRWFNSIRAWKIEKVAQYAANQSAFAQPQPQPAYAQQMVNQAPPAIQQVIQGAPPVQNDLPF